MTTISAALFERSVASPNLPPSAREQYQKLATTLHQIQAERGTQSLVISSAVASEGKTLTASNLAITLSQSFKRRVLLVDADLRRPGVHAFFETPLSPGLAEALRGGPGEVPAMVPVTDSLNILTAGSTMDPIGVLSSDRMHLFVEQVKPAFDWILFDTPPVGLLADAKLVASHTDGVVLVVAAGQTPSGMIQGALDAFGRNRILGVVLNRADDHVVTGGYYDDYYRYAGSDPRKR
jgi:capsular exopolysaccharide synthesis family protein